MFLPLKSGVPLQKVPVVTILVCVVCVIVFFKQLDDWRKWNVANARYCNSDHSRITQMVFTRLSERLQILPCELPAYIALEPDPQATIEELVTNMRPLKGFDRADSAEYVTGMLQDELARYRRVVPPFPDDGLAYYTATWNPWHMITASFGHGDWGHIIFNLVFFVAFATTVEALIGSLAFAGVIVAISLFTGVFSSVSAMATGIDFRTLGLSGVVMGVIGLHAYLLPRGSIRCFYWFIVIFGTISVPAWALAVWYIGGDLYQLFAHDDHGVVNVMAHVTGGIGGYLIGVSLLRKARGEARLLQLELDGASRKPKFG